MDPTSALPLPRRHRRRLTLAAALAALVALVAVAVGLLGGGQDDAATSMAPDMALADTTGSSAAGSSADGSSPVAGASVDRAVGGLDAGAEVATDTPSSPDLAQPAIVRTGTVALEARDIARTRLEVRRILAAQQGEVSEQETTTGDDGRIDTLRLVARMPVDRFAATTAALEDVARLLDSSATSEDVSTEVVDVDARVRAQRESVDRIRALLARATTIEQIVAIEGQLATRQGDLDALLARQAWLAQNTATSTVTVTVQRPPSDRDRDDDDGFTAGLQAGWDAFVDGARGLAVAVGFALPWLGLLGVVSAPVWAWRRRRNRPASPPATV